MLRRRRAEHETIRDPQPRRVDAKDFTFPHFLCRTRVNDAEMACNFSRPPHPTLPTARGKRVLYNRRRSASRAHFLISGFTLLEVVIVLLIITIILGIVGVNLTRDQSDILRDEAERLALVLQNAQQQAILEGRPYGFTFTDTGYRFLRLNDDGRLVPIDTDELLSPRRLPPAILLTPERSAAKDTTNDKSTDAKKRSDLIVFDPSGEFPAFTFVLSVGDVFWYVRGQSDGRVVPSPLPEPAAA